MNDPGLDDPIENSANRVEGEIEGPEKPEDVQKEEEQAFLDPRYSPSPCLSQQQTNNVFQSLVVRVYGLPTARSRLTMCTYLENILTKMIT